MRGGGQMAGVKLQVFGWRQQVPYKKDKEKLFIFPLNDEHLEPVEKKP